jgi:hypothetical protein
MKDATRLLVDTQARIVQTVNPMLGISSHALQGACLLLFMLSPVRKGMRYTLVGCMQHHMPCPTDNKKRSGRVVPSLPSRPSLSLSLHLKERDFGLCMGDRSGAPCQDLIAYCEERI